MRNLFIGFLILAAVLVGGSIVAGVAYQAGVSTAVTTVAATAPDGVVVTPVAPAPYPYGYGWGWGWGHGGFPFFGILAGLFFLFLLFALIRAATWRGRGWGGYGPGRWGSGGPGGPGGWGDHDHRARFQQTFDELHRQSHEGTPPKDPGA
jgi:hypothetical protein